MKLLTNEQQKSYENAKTCYICKERFEDKYAKDKKYISKLDTTSIMQVNTVVLHKTCNLKYSAPKKRFIVFNNASNYHYHFIIKELAEEFKGEFTCLGENTEKYITFSVPIRKVVVRIDKKRKRNHKNHKLQFIDSGRFFAS